MFSQKTEQDPNEAIKMRCKERKICSKGKQQKSKRSDEISYRQNDLRNNLSARSLNRKDKKSVHVYSRKRLTFLCVCLLIRWKQRRLLVSWAFWTDNNVRFLLYTAKRKHNVAPWYERQTSFIYSFCWLTFKVWSFPLSFPPPSPSSKEKETTLDQPKTWLHS